MAVRYNLTTLAESYQFLTTEADETDYTRDTHGGFTGSEAEEAHREEQVAMGD